MQLWNFSSVPYSALSQQLWNFPLVCYLVLLCFNFKHETPPGGMRNKPRPGGSLGTPLPPRKQNPVTRTAPGRLCFSERPALLSVHFCFNKIWLSCLLFVPLNSFSWHKTRTWSQELWGRVVLWTPALSSSPASPRLILERTPQKLGSSKFP